uniref:Kringle domain-containing protein n=1 Tax=Chelydra serpentina TaxID=8475 RepID=A0A8C3XNG8_CHESE
MAHCNSSVHISSLSYGTYLSLLLQKSFLRVLAPVWSGLCGIGPLGYYNGSLAVTESGSECLNWAEFPDYVQQYPDRGLGNHNYCRNPDGEATPWCFYQLASGAIGWASCDCNQGKYPSASLLGSWLRALRPYLWVGGEVRWRLVEVLRCIQPSVGPRAMSTAQ